MLRKMCETQTKIMEMFLNLNIQMWNVLHLHFIVIFFAQIHRLFENIVSRASAVEVMKEKISLKANWFEYWQREGKIFDSDFFIRIFQGTFNLKYSWQRSCNENSLWVFQWNLFWKDLLSWQSAPEMESWEKL